MYNDCSCFVSRWYDSLVINFLIPSGGETNKGKISL